MSGDGAVTVKPKATREAYGEALAALGETYPNVVALDADLSSSTKSALFGRRFPARFFQMGIAEQNMIGVAAGLGLSGKNAFCSSFACFLTGRFETIKMSVAYGAANVKLVGTHGGVGVGADGYSQMGLEDVSLMRALPGMRVYQPADDVETAQIVAHLCALEGPAYLRLTRQAVPRVHRQDYRFVPGALDTLREGGDLAIFATGGVVGEALDAAGALAEAGIGVAVVNVPTLKPLDAEGVGRWAGRVGHILCVEDHNVVGGLGSAVAEAAAEHGSARVLRHGIKDEFGESGSQEALYRKHELDAAGIAAVARRWLRR